jgi:hypothetical protein
VAWQDSVKGELEDVKNSIKELLLEVRKQRPSATTQECSEVGNTGLEEAPPLEVQPKGNLVSPKPPVEVVGNTGLEEAPPLEVQPKGNLVSPTPPVEVVDLVSPQKPVEDVAVVDPVLVVDPVWGKPAITAKVCAQYSIIH